VYEERPWVTMRQAVRNCRRKDEKECYKGKKVEEKIYTCAQTTFVVIWADVVVVVVR
jgi:hypothetical protein